jgi:hypothetical protein
LRFEVCEDEGARKGGTYGGFEWRLGEKMVIRWVFRSVACYGDGVGGLAWIVTCVFEYDMCALDVPLYDQKVHAVIPPSGIHFRADAFLLASSHRNPFFKSNTQLPDHDSSPTPALLWIPSHNGTPTFPKNQFLQLSDPFIHRLGLSGLLNPPTRFIYCLYSVFFSFLTPETSFPFTFVFFVDANPANPIARLIAAISGSESTSMLSSSAEAFGSGVTEEAAPLVGFEVPFLSGGREGVGGGGGLAELRGPVGGMLGRGRSEAGLGGGLRDRVRLEGRGGVRVRVLAGGRSLRGEAERVRGRSGRRDGGSSCSGLLTIPQLIGI